MKSIDPARLAKLPAWARDEITDLQRKVADLDRTLVRLGGTTGEHYIEQRAVATPYQRRFDDTCSVFFGLGARRGTARGDIEVRRIELPGGSFGLDICGLSGSLVIRASASNRLVVTEEER